MTNIFQRGSNHQPVLVESCIGNIWELHLALGDDVGEDVRDLPILKDAQRVLGMAIMVAISWYPKCPKSGGNGRNARTCFGAHFFAFSRKEASCSAVAWLKKCGEMATWRLGHAPVPTVATPAVVHLPRIAQKSKEKERKEEKRTE